MLKSVLEWVTVCSMIVGAIMGLLFINNSLTLQLNPSVLETYVMGVLIFCGISFVGNLPAMTYFMLVNGSDDWSNDQGNFDGDGI